MSIQRAFLTNETQIFETKNGPEKQRSDRWRHTGSPKPHLGPTLDWIKIPFTRLESVSAEDLTKQRELDLKDGKKLSSLEHHVADPDGPMFLPVLGENRTFQLRFRAQALQVWGAKCAVSGATCLLEAAHLMSVSSSRINNDAAMTDQFNSIILNIAVHALLDEGLVAFSNDGDLLVSSKLNINDRKIFGVNTHLKVSFHRKAIKYVEHHRINVFREGT